ncbi:MAG TPA: glycine zipper domain-containing protein [Planctomycetota bacterium]|mgnify:CR=1 FL=1|nr:glycine zipper domain-containing protein [Planctomycetota bacterium]HRR80779.1 glycine zipper domain-containing protein [Planctomycetota bacterium]HRT97063.1 glycine zipper domain-containing protein [Planctomycetota bacterium]
MNQRLCKRVAVLCVAALASQGCGWIRDNPKTVTGAAIGAAAGGALGYAVSGHHRRGRAVIGGALIGALAGGIIGNMMERRDREAAATNQAYNYAPAQGTRVEVAGALVDPAATTPGGTVNLQVTYAVMAPNDQTAVPLVETRVVTFNGTKVAELTSNVSRTPGTYTTQVPIQLRADTPKGQYQLDVVVAGAGAQGQRSATFVVN